VLVVHGMTREQFVVLDHDWAEEEGASVVKHELSGFGRYHSLSCRIGGVALGCDFPEAASGSSPKVYAHVPSHRYSHRHL
jgi:hypothetical protein